MPVLFINTNVAAPVPANFVKNASQTVAKLTGKPESYVMVLVNNGLSGSFAGSPDPFIYAELQSIGGFSSNNKVASELTNLFNNQLGVPGNRVYVKLMSPNAGDFAFNGQTFG